jgi:hypothetical protein
MSEAGARNVRQQQTAGAGRTPPCTFSSLHFVVKATVLPIRPTGCASGQIGRKIHFV